MTDPQGSDLRVLLGPPGMSASDASALDLRTRPRPHQRAAPRPGLVREAAAPAQPQGWASEPEGTADLLDLDTISGRENVAQALILRLLTPRGALADLGHASYGSRLGELVGRGKTEAVRGLCRAYVLQAVREEPRVQDKPLAVMFDVAAEQPWDFVVQIVVQPASGGDPLAVGVTVPL